MSKIDTARLRGTLAQSVDARALESAARTPCHRLGAIVAAGADPKQVAEKVYGSDKIGSAGEISPFARAIGVAFEEWLFGNDANELRSLYRDTTGWYPASVEDLRHLHKGEHEEAERRTSVLVEQRLATGSGPEIILGARFSLNTDAGTDHIHPDVLIAKPGWCRFRVGDVKSYLDLDGRTDPIELATAVRQIAVGVVALRQAHGEASADDSVDVILRVPRKPGASIRTMDAAVEVATITTWLANSGNFVSEALVATDGQSFDSRIGLETISHKWEASCEGHCPLSVACREEAIGRDELMLLGDTTLAALGGVKTITRATELASGSSPKTSDEERIAPDLYSGWEASRLAEESLVVP
jgi:hypothetical protein